MNILVTGGAGYIGSHTCVMLLEAGYNVIVVDNFINSKMESINRVEKITDKKIKFYEVDLLNKEKLEPVFKKNTIDSVIHFAGLKAVGESVEKPLYYFHNNITGILCLTEIMLKYNVNNIVFSSSATVYGDPDAVPVTEACSLHPTNPYGKTKYFIEEILKDLHTAHPQLNIALLRYFNPIGAHPSGIIGEDPNGIPNNLVPYIAQVAVGIRPVVSVYGDDYNTPDGTGVRDYIHVVDLANGHLKAIEKLSTNPGVVIYNLGTGKGYSVLDVIKAFEKACKKEIKYKVVNRKPGDIATCYADPTFAQNELNWKAGFSIDDMCQDTWNWQSKNPKGYG